MNTKNVLRLSGMQALKTRSATGDPIDRETISV